MAEAASSPPKTTFLQIPQVLSRPHSELEFDSGINTSAAWTVSLASPEGGARLSLNSIHSIKTSIEQASISEEVEADDDGSVAEDDDSLYDEEGRPARALYTFHGKAEFRELTRVEAGDELEIMREDVGEGWSLARLAKTSQDRDSGSTVQANEMGLIPRSYYIFTAEFVHTEGLLVPSTHSRFRSRREASSDSITPRGSPTRHTEALPIIPQNTGEWFPSFRRSLLGGKSLNRFSSFVTSGAEEFVLQGSSEDASAATPQPVPHSRSVSEDESKRESVLGNIAEAERHFVEAGPSWKAKVPPFRVLVHSPSKRTSTLSGAYTMYTVTTAFEALSHARSASDPADDGEGEPPSPMRITVHRRFSHFVALHTALTRLLPGIALPPLPEKQYAGRFSDDFVEARRGDLERYINRVVRHPVARYAEVLTFFLGCESDADWKRQLPYYLSLPPKGPSFYANVYHPAFNVDAEEASEAIDRFVNHTRAVGKGVQSLRNIFGKVREARVEMSKAERLLSYSLLSLITAQPLAAAPTTGISEDDEEQTTNHSVHGHVNEDGAWCWRENCDSCLKLTKAMQKTSETLQIVADLYDDHARRTQLATHEALKSVAHPSTLYAPVVETLRSTLSRYTESIQEGGEDEEMAARCETVLNITMAEMDTYHTQKVEDFQNLAKEHLDGEIAFYEQILTRLRTARRAYDSPQYDELSRGPRQPSIYERDLEHPRLNPPPITQPCPHVFDSAPMRPVSVAIQEGVGMLLGGVGSPSRGSVFGKFW
ncbi:PX-domain-containing protein [Trametes coccinea BRFM310]|uniref:PX-domain-containing protein n=1 Tax=Trametes coccinea (strain BRFM310) TaxID=1353009 RepID=A0A1Y2IWZ2_TRAC3|nr:PX-domain-containing protein [Trametes coccinea BRFM310]